MTKKKTADSSPRKIKASKRKESTPKAVRFSIGQLPIVEGVVKVLQSTFPDQHMTVNKFIVSATMYCARMKQEVWKKQLSLFAAERHNVSVDKGHSPQRKRIVNKKPSPVKLP